MNDWSEGYFTDSTYTYGYYRELSPVFMRWCLLLNGIAAPELTEDGCHCELGYGQGISANIHAAATPGKFFGTDFNPAHSAQANELAKASGADAKFFEDSFEEFAKRNDLPQFDSIGFHGIWTWVNAENRQHMLEIARRHLKSGGMLYNSYNCLPGWSPNAPLRELLTLYYKQLPAGDTNKRVASTLQFIGEMLVAEPAYLMFAPQFKTTFEGLKGKDAHYIAHEYLNADWDLMYFTDVAELCQAAKLEFAATALPIEFGTVHLPAKARAFLGKVDNRLMREQLQDYFINRQFRKDICVRGLRRLSQAEVWDKLLSMRYVLTTPAAEAPLRVGVPMGEVTLSEELYRPLLNYFEEDSFRPKDLIEYVVRSKSNPQALIGAIAFLVHANHVMPCQSEAAIKAVKKSCERLNAYICERATFSDKIKFLASPLTGCGFSVDRFRQMFLAQYRKGEKTANGIAEAVWQIVSRQGQVLTQNGKRFDTPAENLEQLKNLTAHFLSNELPIFKALLIA